MGVSEIDKHSSLLQNGRNYDRKIFYSTSSYNENHYHIDTKMSTQRIPTPSKQAGQADNVWCHDTLHIDTLLNDTVIMMNAVAPCFAKMPLQLNHLTSKLDGPQHYPWGVTKPSFSM
jgi:hypothetical protein